MPESALITGAAGFIGSHLAERCLSLGWRVTMLDAFTDYYDPTVKERNVARAAGHPNGTLVRGDLLDIDLRPLLADASVVFHLAAQPGVRSSWDEFATYARRNIEATHRLLAAAVEASIERFVLASSSSIYGDAEALPTREDVRPRPVSPYGVTKLASEHLADAYHRNFGLQAVAVRYFTVYGPRQRPDMAFSRVISQMLAGQRFEVFGDGLQTRDFTFVEDAVAGTIAAAERGHVGRTYNIGGGSRHSMNSVFETLERLTGTGIERAYRDRQAGDARDTAADIGRAREDLGYAPTMTLEAGLRAQLEWQRASQATLAPLA